MVMKFRVPGGRKVSFLQKLIGQRFVGGEGQRHGVVDWADVFTDGHRDAATLNLGETRPDGSERGPKLSGGFAPDSLVKGALMTSSEPSFGISIAQKGSAKRVNMEYTENQTRLIPRHRVLPDS